MNNKILYTMLAAALFFQLPTYADTDNYQLKERYSIYYNNGVNLYKEKKYTSAIGEFKKAVRISSLSPAAIGGLYRTYISRAEYYLNTEKQPKKAINDLKSALFYMKYWSPNETAPEAPNYISKLNELSKKYENTPADLKLSHAKNLRAQGEITAAGYDLNTIKTNPKYSYEANLLLSDIYKSLNNRKMALDTIAEAVKINPESGLAHYKYALIYEEIKNTGAADDEYALAFKYGDNDTLEALKSLWIARSVNNPKNVDALINLGAIYQKQKQYDLARAQYIKAEALKPKDPVILTNLASLYFETKDFKGAIAQYKKVLTIDPNNEGAKEGIKLAISSLTGDDLLSYLREDATANQYNYDKQFNYAFELHKNKKYQEAITYYKKAIAINPKMPEPYINIAQIYRLQNDTTHANAAISHGLSNLSDNKELLSLKKDIETEAAANLYNSAADYFNAGDYKTALSTYLKIPMQTPEVLYSIASCYFELNDNLKASEYLNKVLALEPNHKEARAALDGLKQGEEGKNLEMAISAYENKKYNESLELLDKVLSYNPNNPYALYYKGAVYEETKRQNEAIAEYKKAIKADQNFSLAYYMLGVALDAKEQYKEAVSYYEQYLAIKQKEGVQDDYTKYVNERLKELKDYLEQQKKS